MSLPPRIRSATSGDLALLVALDRAAFGGDAAPAWCLRQWIDLGGSLCAVAGGDAAEAVGEPILGAVYSAVAVADDRGPRLTAWVLSVAVDPAARGRGIADTLLAAVEAKLRGRGVDELLATVAPGNAASRRLFARRGYTEHELVPAYFGPGEDRILLSLTIGS